MSLLFISIYVPQVRTNHKDGKKRKADKSSGNLFKLLFTRTLIILLGSYHTAHYFFGTSQFIVLLKIGDTSKTS